MVRDYASALLLRAKTYRLFLSWLIFFILPSGIIFLSSYSRILSSLSSFEASQEAGAYPLAMVLFLILWILLNGRGEFLPRLKDKTPKFRLEAVLLAGIFTAASTVLAYAHFTSSFRSDILLNVIILLFWYEGTLLLILPDAGKHAFRYLAVYIPTSLVQYIGSIFFGAPVSQAFLTLLKPVAESTGWPVQIVVSKQFIDAGGNGLMVYTGSAGLPAISVFLLLAGLVYLDVRPPRRIFLVSLTLGLLLTVVLNMFRILILIWIAIVDWASWDFYHSILGYMIFSIFYVAFVLFMSRPSIYRSAVPQLESSSIGE